MFCPQAARRSSTRVRVKEASVAASPAVMTTSQMSVLILRALPSLETSGAVRAPWARCAPRFQTTGLRCRHAVPPDHPAGQVVGDVAVVEPVPRVVLRVLHRQRRGGSDDLGVDEASGFVLPAVAVDVEDVELLPEGRHAPPDPVADLCLERGGIAQVAGAVEGIVVLAEAGQIL